MKLKIEIAETPAALAQGLMWRKDLPDDAGMLFKFPTRTEARFWGKDTYIPLDVAFVNGDTIIDIKSITPLSTRSVCSKGLCNIAIEANAGFFARHGIKEGHKIQIENGQVSFVHD